MDKFEIRAVQLDLARQMESIDFIKEFIDFAVNSGFNAIFLYLEGRIKTTAFPFPPANQSYTPEQMREIAGYAAQRNIDVIPAIQTLAHAELFLQYKAMQSMSELRDTGGAGRWSGICSTPNSFCPSSEETKSFQEHYLTELAEIFPSRYFSTGLDEAWHIGICELCRRHSGGQGGIFADHIKWLHAVITGKLGRKMLIWDDMFQHYPEVLELIPKDIILCVWHYDAVMHFPRWHFGTRERIDKLNLYAKHGFESIICPADYTLRNTTSFTRYAGRRPCAGGLLTIWEKSDCFYYESFPVIAYAGYLWQGMNCEEAFSAAALKIFECSHPVFLAALKTVKEINIGYWRRDTDPENFLRGNFGEEEYIIKSLTRSLTSIFLDFLEKIPSVQGRLVLENILLRLEYGDIYTRGREVIPEFFDPLETPSAETRQRLEALVAAYRRHYSKMCSFWEKVRPGIPHSSLDAFFDTAIKNFASLADKPAEGLLTLRLFDRGVTQDSEVMIKFEDSSDWQSIFQTRLTPYYNNNYHERSFAVPADQIPVAIRFESWGYGTQGISFLEINNFKGRFIPDKIAEITGRVASPEHILFDDINYAELGEPYSIENFNDHGTNANKKRHGIELLLKKEQF